MIDLFLVVLVSHLLGITYSICKTESAPGILLFASGGENKSNLNLNSSIHSLFISIVSFISFSV